MTLCLTLLPTAALADAETQSYPRHEHTVGNYRTTFTAWTDELAEAQNGAGKTAANSLPSQADYYYLTDDVQLNATWKPTGDTMLCLNGHSITNKSYYGGISVGSDVTFTLCDCNGSNKTYHFEKDKYGLWQLNESGSHAVTGGIITSTGSGYGSGVYVAGGGTFNMYGGTIVGNNGTSTSEGHRGGGVYVLSNTQTGTKGTFNMYDGVITGNSVTGETADVGGGGVFVYGIFNMSGGEITENTALRYTCGGGVTVASGGTFTMTRGEIKGNNAYRSGGGVFAKNATFNMSGGEIIGNTSNGSGGIEVYGSTFNMSGNAKIIDNIGNGVDVHTTSRNDSIFNMSGNAAVTGNNGGGVYVSDTGTKVTSFTVSDSVQVTGNTNGGIPQNVYLQRYNNANMPTITIGEDHLSGATIGVTTEIKPENEKQVLFATNASESDKNCFTSDESQIIVCNDKALYLKQHIHNWTYQLNEARDTITAACAAENCPQNTGTVTIAAPADALTYDGTAKAATLTNNLPTGVTVPTITYEKKYSETEWAPLNSAPTDAGEYIASITLGEGESAKTANVTYTINKRTLTAADFTFTPPTDLIYNGKAKTASVELNSRYTNCGEIIVKYFKDKERVNEAKDLGIYTVKIDVTGGGNFNPAEDLTADDWAFVIQNPHDHTYGAWSSDAEKHWHECTDADCPDKNGSIKDTAAHVYDRDTDADCNVCGYHREISVLVTAIVLDNTTAALKVGETKTLTATVEPSNATNKNVTWTSSDTAVAAVNNGTVTAVKEGTAVITATAADGSGKSADCTVTVTAATSGGGSSSGGSSSGGSSSSGSSSSGGSSTKTETKTNPDGSTTKTETRSDGTVIENTTGKDGSTVKTTTKKDGSSVTESKTADGTTSTVKTDTNGQTEAETKISDKAIKDAKKSGDTVKVPTEVKSGKDSNSAPTIKITLPKNAGETTIEIPVKNVSSGTVAILVHEDGTEEIVKNSKPTENGVQLTLNDSTTVKIIDNSKDFIDTRDHWSRDEVNFVASRDIFNGIGNNMFGVNNPMTRGMINTVLARLSGVDTTPKNDQKWYEVGTEWAKKNGITDGTNPEASVTREQLATMLYRFSGTPEVSGKLNFADADTVSEYAENAVLWATQNGILNGVGNARIAPNAEAQRAQVAAMMARYLKDL